MSEVFTEDQVIARVTRLTRLRLTAFVEAEAVVPVVRDAQPRFRAADLARLDLLCELTELYDMEPEALAVMLSVIDNLHAARRERDALLAAIRGESADVQGRIVAVLAQRPNNT